MGETIGIGTKGLANTFIHRKLKYKLIGGKNQAGNNVFISNNKDNSEMLEHYRSEVKINCYGGSVLEQATITIYNMPINLANVISTVGFYNNEAWQTQTQIEVYATTDSSTEENPVWTKIFTGNIMVSYADMNAQPNVNVRIEAQTMGGTNLLPADSISFKGKVQAEDVIKGIINKYQKRYSDAPNGLTSVKNLGVTATLNNPNYSGPLLNQLQTCANDADFEYSINGGILYMFPSGGDVQFSPLTFSPATGMIGYPSYSGNGIVIRSLFKPTLKWAQKIRVNTNSQFKQVDGIWQYMVSMEHDLSCEMPGGPWFTTIEMANQNTRGAMGDGG